MPASFHEKLPVLNPAGSMMTNAAWTEALFMGSENTTSNTGVRAFPTDACAGLVASTVGAVVSGAGPSVVKEKDRGPVFVHEFHCLVEQQRRLSLRASSRLRHADLCYEWMRTALQSLRLR